MQKIKRLVAQFHEQQAEGARYNPAIEANPGSPGFGAKDAI